MGPSYEKKGPIVYKYMEISDRIILEIIMSDRMSVEDYRDMYVPGQPGRICPDSPQRVKAF